MYPGVCGYDSSAVSVSVPSMACVCVCVCMYGCMDVRSQYGDTLGWF